jgi:glycosyltransferase involved in cell wall biosynthesis
MLRILMVLDREFPPDIRVENEIEVLIKSGHEVHIACYTQKHRPVLECLNGLTIHRKPISSFMYKSSVACLTLPFYFHFWKKFIAEIGSVQPFDVIHIHDLPLSRIGIWFKKTLDIHLIIDLHENWPAFLRISMHTNTLTGRLLSPISLWRWYEKNVLHRADDIIVVVDEAKTRLTRLGIPPHKIFVVSNTINLVDLRLSIPLHGEGIILYYAGGINFHRGLQNVILALKKANNEKLRFWILGDGSYKSELIALVDQLSLKEQVIFFGHQSFSKVMEMLSQADFAIIPHLKTEHTDSTIPHKLFQYMYAGKPVIASNCLPLQRIIEETGAGVVYPSDNIDFLSDLLHSLGEMKSNEMADRGKKAVIEKYNWNQDGEVLLNLYRKLLP